MKSDIAAAAALPCEVIVQSGSGDPLDETLALMAATDARIATAVDDQAAQFSFAVLAQRLAAGPVGARVRTAVLQGWWRAGYPRERDAICAVAAAGLQMGAAPGFARRALTHPRSKLSDTPLNSKMVDILEQRVRARLTESDRRRNEAAARSAHWASTVPLSCSRTSTSRAVLETLARTASAGCRHAVHPDGTETVLVAVSSRRLAADANLNPATVRRTLQRLTDAGLLARHPPLKAQHATVWELPAPPVNVAPSNVHEPWSDLGNDAAHAYALGKTLALTLRAMTPGVEFTAAELSVKLSSSPSATRTRLNRLRRLGLVARRGQRWSACSVAPTQVAEHFGTTGRRARRRSEYRRAREARAAHVASHTQSRSSAKAS